LEVGVCCRCSGPVTSVPSTNREDRRGRVLTGGDVGVELEDIGEDIMTVNRCQSPLWAVMSMVSRTFADNDVSFRRLDCLSITVCARRYRERLRRSGECRLYSNVQTAITYEEGERSKYIDWGVHITSDPKLGSNRGALCASLYS
jgi:hypothetical protein